MNLRDEELTQAVALFYDGEHTPTITAMGEGELGDTIIELAKEHGVTLCNNGPLVELLMQLELGDEVPEALYIAIAHIIAFAYELQGKELTTHE